MDRLITERHPEILSAYLARAGVGVTAFARLIGVTQPTVSGWLKGHRPVPPLRAVRIEKITGGELSRRDFYPELYE